CPRTSRAPKAATAPTRAAPSTAKTTERRDIGTYRVGDDWKGPLPRPCGSPSRAAPDGIPSPVLGALRLGPRSAIRAVTFRQSYGLVARAAESKNSQRHYAASPGIPSARVSGFP